MRQTTQHGKFSLVNLIKLKTNEYMMLQQYHRLPRFWAALRVLLASRGRPQERFTQQCWDCQHGGCRWVLWEHHRFEEGCSSARTTTALMGCRSGGAINSFIGQQALGSGFCLLSMGTHLSNTSRVFSTISFYHRWHPLERERDRPDRGQPERGCGPAEKHQLFSGAQGPGDEDMWWPGAQRGCRAQRVVAVLGDVAGAAPVSLAAAASRWRGVGGKICVLWQFSFLAWFIALTC